LIGLLSRGRVRFDMTDGGLLDKTLADYNRVYQQWNAPKSDDDLNLSR
jgi:hypothetical protein